MEIQQEVDLKPYNSFGVSAIAAEFADVTDAAQLPELFAYAGHNHLPVLILGGGSNLLLVNDYPGLVIRIALTGMEFDEGSGKVQVKAGENWHAFVSECMNKGFHGLENLALIPGTVGAAPVQNIGAYGVELEQFLESVQVYDSGQDEFRVLSRDDCDFAYRDSLFKHEAGQGLIITEVTLQLSRQWQPNTSYQALQDALDTAEPTPQQLFDTVCAIRSSKLPDPARLGNAGSFFKNPVISNDKYKKLLEEFPDLPSYPVAEEGLLKVPAAWLLDALGWKGRQRGAAAVHEQHALVLVNTGSASGEDLYLLAQEMSTSVLTRFGIALQPEVRIL
ncbi:MAG: UDP-N-acetylmuramate dehydrogenase [Pseudomonadales bacterium]|nr:UDP-N-acetylmuramate dehydrogenase [Pseudomonadales bacterium]